MNDVCEAMRDEGVFHNEKALEYWCNAPATCILENTKRVCEDCRRVWYNVELRHRISFPKRQIKHPLDCTKPGEITASKEAWKRLAANLDREAFRTHMNETVEQMYLGKETSIRYGGEAMNDPQVGNQYVCEKCGYGPFDPRRDETVLNYDPSTYVGQITLDAPNLSLQCPKCKTSRVRKWRQSDDNSSRLKRVRVSIRTMMTYLFQQTNLPRCIELPELQLPEGYRIVRVGCPSDGSHTVEVTVQHSSFPALREGEVPPQLDECGLMWRVHELKQPDEPTPQAVEQLKAAMDKLEMKRWASIPVGQNVEATHELKSKLDEMLGKIPRCSELTQAEQEELTRRVNERVREIMADKPLDVATSVWNDKLTLVDDSKTLTGPDECYIADTE